MIAICAIYSRYLQSRLQGLQALPQGFQSSCIDRPLGVNKKSSNLTRMIAEPLHIQKAMPIVAANRFEFPRQELLDLAGQEPFPNNFHCVFRRILIISAGSIEEPRQGFATCPCLQSSQSLFNVRRPRFIGPQRAREYIQILGKMEQRWRAK